MGILSNLEPKEVFQYFEEICAIPHGSGNMEEISNYLVAFAKERNLFHIQDHMKNVIIIKEATKGYEEEPVIILQGHMDMVAVQKPDCNIDMMKEGLRLAIDGDDVFAEGTSLGGDDGIAVAYGLALLASKEIKHPRLEVIFTVDEEVGMDGAREIDLSMLKGNRMLNIDSEEEGIFLTSCAGGARVDCTLPLSYYDMEGIMYQITVCGLAGGHSGVEIHKERGNSNVLMGRVLWNLVTKCHAGIVDFKGGLADNAIPRETTLKVVVKEEQSDLLLKILTELESQMQDELAVKDSDITIVREQIKTGKFPCVIGELAENMAGLLFSLPNGVQGMSPQIHGLVETSLNMGVVSMDELGLRIGFSVRSSIESEKQALIQKIKAITKMVSGEIKVTGDYPGWQYRMDSPLRDKMIRIYKDMYQEEPKVEAIHAGLECGLLGSKLSDLDCVSLGPNMTNIHTTEETLSISSTKRVWEFLVRVLEEK